MTKKSLFLIFILYNFIPASNYLSGQENLTPNVSESTPYPSIAGMGFSLFPGLFFHGSGHYLTGEKKTGKNIFWIGNISLLSLLGSSVIYGASGAASILSPVMIPLIFFSASTYLISWVADFSGTAGLSKILKEDNPYTYKTLKLSYTQKNDHQTPYKNFYGISGQLSHGNHYLTLNFEQEFLNRYQKYNLIYGYLIWKTPYTDLYLVPDFSYERSYEKFSISRGLGKFYFILNLQWIGESLKNIYIENILGYGKYWYHFNTVNYFNDFNQTSLFISQGIRVSIKNFINVGTSIARTNSDLIGSSGFFILYYRAYTELIYKKIVTSLEYKAGKGSSFSISTGIKI